MRNRKNSLYNIIFSLYLLKVCMKSNLSAFSQTFQVYGTMRIPGELVFYQKPSVYAIVPFAMKMKQRRKFSWHVLNNL